MSISCVPFSVPSSVPSSVPFCVRRPALSLFILALVFFFSSAAAAGPPVKIVSFSFPPILHRAANGQFSGTMGETVRALCVAAGLECQFDVMPLKRAYREVKNGGADALITINVGQLTDCCIASDWASPWRAGFFSSSAAEAIPNSPSELIGRGLFVVSGMKSPYFFAKNLDQMATEGSVVLHKAPDIPSSIRMFLRGRAPLLWGGEDFKWYLGKLDKTANYSFKPFFEKPVVVWVRKDKPAILAQFNRALKILQADNSLDDKNLLTPPLMQRRYRDAPFIN